MSLIDYIMLGIITASVTGAVIRIIRKRKKGCSECGNCKQSTYCLKNKKQ